MNQVLICGGNSFEVMDVVDTLKSTEKISVQHFSHGLDMVAGVISAMHPDVLIVSIPDMNDGSYNTLTRIQGDEPNLHILAYGNDDAYKMFLSKFVGNRIEQLKAPFQKKEGTAAICRAMGMNFSEVAGAVSGQPGGQIDMNAMAEMLGVDVSVMASAVGGAGMQPMGMMQQPVTGGPDLSAFGGLGGMAPMPGVIKAPDNGKPSIMIIDDNAMTLRSMKGLLEDEFNVYVANSGPKAFKVMTNIKPNLILLDYEMPEMDGREVMQKLRNDERLFDVPVIFLTGVNDREHISAALALRPSGYLLKPVAKAKLLSTIESTLSGGAIDSGLIF